MLNFVPEIDRKIDFYLTGELEPDNQDCLDVEQESLHDVAVNQVVDRQTQTTLPLEVESIAPVPIVVEDRVRPQRKTTVTIKTKDCVDSVKKPTNKDDISNLEHLKPLPRPLSDYFKESRPNQFYEFEARWNYLKRMVEKRIERKNATPRLDQILMLRHAKRRCNTNHIEPRNSQEHHVAPNYFVKCKLSEYEMKQRTARIYHSLPEVKDQEKEKIKNYQKIQFYNNRKVYGKKLLENRRHGKINYPIRSKLEGDFLDSTEPFQSYP